MTAFAHLSAAALVDARPLFAIEAESVADVAAREALLDAAMGPGRTRKSSEAIRRGRLPAQGLAFVARGLGGEVVGTVRLWDVCAGDGRPALLLGPLAVSSAYEGVGIGSALMRHALAEAARLGHGAVLLVGDPAYYERFGFSSTMSTDLFMPGPFERHRLQGLELVAGSLSGAAGMIAPTGREAPAEGLAA